VVRRPAGAGTEGQIDAVLRVMVRLDVPVERLTAHEVTRPLYRHQSRGSRADRAA
jgi:hypothetical protein